MPQLQLLDEETGGKYIFNLTEHEFARASTGEYSKILFWNIL